MPKKRVKRQLVREFLVYCEGKTERHYIDGLRRWLHECNPSSRVKIKSVEIKGGGYGAILNILKKEPDSNCMARIVLLDFDRYKNVEGEAAFFRKLVDYSKTSYKKAVPCILVVSNENFEYALCCHDACYNEIDSTTFLCKSWGYRNLDDCKADERIWDKAHAENRGHEWVMKRMEGKSLVVENDIDIKHSKTAIKLKQVRFDEALYHIRGVNLKDLFDLVCLS